MPYTLMQILGPVVGGHLYMRPLDQNLGDASQPSPCGYAHDILAAVRGGGLGII